MPMVVDQEEEMFQEENARGSSEDIGFEEKCYAELCGTTQA
jgi:hypothetical protein